ncbi:unnamed protein product [Diamesa serratosioi]
MTANFIFRSFLVVFSVFGAVNAVEYCDASFCNNGGLCKEIRNKRVCECIPDTYNGTYCEEIVNNCNPNPCSDSASCTTYPGNFNCECKTADLTNNCSISILPEYAPQNPYFLFNPLILINEPHEFLLILETLGDTRSTLEISIPNYVLVNEQITFTNQKVFQKIAVQDLKNLIKKMNLKNGPEFKKNFYFYSVFKNTLTDIGLQSIMVLFVHFKNKTLYYRRRFNVMVYARNNYCLPKVSLEDCKIPTHPQTVLFHQFNSFNPIIERNCSRNSKLVYKWSVNHLLDTKVYDVLSDETENSIRFPPFSLWYDDIEEVFVSFYTIKLIVLEEDQEEQKSGMAVSRCFINVLIPRPEIKIKGGLFRNIANKEEFIVDAGESIDYASNHNQKNPISFTWNCTSELKNTYCSKLTAKTPQVHIPAGTFKESDKVVFNVNGTSKKTKKSSNGVQEVKFVDEASLFVWIKCVKNCGKITLIHNIYHAEAVCENCNAKDLIEYQWDFKGNNISSSSRAIILPYFIDSDVSSLTVTVSQNKKTSTTSIDLITDTAPPQKCKITPDTGIAFVTEFEIECDASPDKSLEKKNRPTKSIYQNNVFLVKFSSRSYKLILNEMPDGVKHIEIKVQSLQGAFVVYNLDVVVEKLKIEHIWKFIRGETGDFSLCDLVEMNDLPKAVAMIYLAIDRMSPDNEEVAKILLDEILKMKLVDSDSIVVLSNVLKEFSSKLLMTHELRGKIAKVFDKISKAINEFVDDSKINPQFTILSVTNITHNMLITTSNLLEPHEMIESHQNLDGINSDDRFDDYQDYEDLDVRVMNKVENLLSTSTSINRLVQSIFKCYVLMVDPEEPPENIMMNNLNFTFFEIDLKNSHENVTLYAFNTTIFFNKSLIRSLNYAKSLKIGLLSFKNHHPFWWATEKTHQLSNVFILDIFAGNGLKIVDLDQRFEFATSFDNVTSGEIDGCVSYNNDMPIYKIEFPAYSKLLLEFYLDDSDELKFLKKIGSRPQFKDVIEKPENIEIIHNKSKLYIEKEVRSENEILFIALLFHQSNKSKNCINFTLSIHTLSCDVWNEKQGPWSGKYCVPLELVNGTQLQCSCNHLSTFTSRLFVPPTFLNLPRGIVYALEKNYTVIVIVVVSVVIFSLLFLWAWKFDDENFKKTKIISLESNHPNHKYYYLVTVVTGGFRKSGTTSKICIELQGLNNSSGPCMLYDDLVLFKTNSECNFLITVPEYLGKLEKIVIWMKPSGTNNSWYCEKISVRDVARKELFSFFVEQWFSLNQSKKSSDWNWVHEIFLSEKKKAEKKLFRHNVFYGIKNSFLAYSIFSHHASSPFTARQRVVVLFCIFAFIMMINILLFGATTLQNVENEQTYYERFQMGINTLVFSLQSVVITIPLALLLEFLLNRESKKSNNELEQKYHAVYREENEE